jgi:hypothetical protein
MFAEARLPLTLRHHERRAASHHQLGLTRPTSPFAHSPTCAERTEDEARKIDVTPRRPQELDPGLGFLFSPDHGGRGARAREMRGACDTPLATRPALAVATPLSFASHRKLTAGGANEKFQRADRRTKPLMLTHPVFILSARRAVLALRPSCYGINEARQAINGDVQLARRFDALSLPRWTADKDFEQLVLAIVRNLPLREPSILTVKGLRRILQTSGGVSARIFRMLNEVAIEAIETGAERITDDALERYKPVGEDEAAFQ